TQTFDGGEADKALGIAVTPEGEVFVTGSHHVGNQSENLWVRRYSSAGTTLWTQEFNDVSNGFEAGLGIAVSTGAGAVFVAGQRESDYQRDILVRKYSIADGADLGMRVIDGAAHGNDSANAVAVDGSINAYVVGFRTDSYSTVKNLMVRKFSPSAFTTGQGGGSPAYGTGKISGNLQYSGSDAINKPFYIRLTQSPDINAPLFSGKVATVTASFPSYDFTDLPDGNYYLRAFADLDNSSTLNLSSEPVGAFPYPGNLYDIQVLNGGYQTGKQVFTCDRRRLVFGDVYGDSLTANCTVDFDYGQSFYGRLYGFSATAGQQVSIEMNADTNWDTVLYLFSPSGQQISYDNDSNGNNNAKIANFTLPETGIYTIVGTSFFAGMMGNFTVKLKLEGGFAGQVSGVISYSGTQSGAVRISLKNDVNDLDMKFSSQAAAGAYSFTQLPDGDFYVSAYMDVNDNGVREPNEPKGESAVVAVANGNAQLASFSLSDPEFGYIGVWVGYTGDITKKMIVRALDPDDDQIQFETVINPNLNQLPSLNIAVLGPLSETGYRLLAFVDSNDNNSADMSEAVGSSYPVVAVNGLQVSATFQAFLPGEAGLPGPRNISGSITYSGGQTGVMKAILFTPENWENEGTPHYMIDLGEPGVGTTGYAFIGIQAGTYFPAAFIDANANNSLEQDEPLGVASLDVPVDVLSGNANSDFYILDPPQGQITGVVTYQGQVSGPIVVRVNRQDQQKSMYGSADTESTRTQGISTYAYVVDNLESYGNYQLTVFVDNNGDGMGGFGEPIAYINNIAIDTNTVPSVMVDAVLFDPGQQVKGQVSGSVSYAGGNSAGPIRVRLFDNASFLGTPVASQEAAAPGVNTGNFALTNIDPGTYYLDAYRDGNFNNYHDPAFEPKGLYSSGASIVIAQGSLFQDGKNIVLQDPGTGGGGPTGNASVSGAIDYEGVATSGTAIIHLVSAFASPAEAPMQSAQTAMPLPANASYVFNDVPQQMLMLRGFIDLNNNFFPDGNEPIGRRGLSSGQNVYGANAGVDFIFCDRSFVNSGVEVNGSLQAGDCVSMDRKNESGFATLADHYSFSGAKGNRVTIDMKSMSGNALDSFIYLLGPSGKIVASADCFDQQCTQYADARIFDFSLPDSGIYTLIATSFGQYNGTGDYKLKIGVSGGGSGSISGAISYNGNQGGQILVAIFDVDPMDDQNSGPISGMFLPGPTSYAFTNLASSKTYFIASVLDVNYNSMPDTGEDFGVYGGTVAPLGVFLQANQQKTGINVTIEQGSAIPAGQGDGGQGRIQGIVSYVGTKAGKLKVEAWNSPYFSGSPAAVQTVNSLTNGQANFSMQVPGNNNYYLKAYLDSNNNFIFDPTQDPKGTYSPFGEGAEPVFVQSASTQTGVDFSLHEPEFTQNYTGSGGGGGGSSAVSGEGIASIAPVSAAAGVMIDVATVTFVVGRSSITSNGKVGVKMPMGWFAGPGTAYSITQAGAAPQANFFVGGDSVGLDIISGMLEAGATVTFKLKNIFIGCQAGNAQFAVASVTNGNGFPQPLTAGSPAIAVVAGAPSFLNIQNGYLTMVTGSTWPVPSNYSSRITLEAKDNCFNTVTAATPIVATVTARSFDQNWTPTIDGNVFLATQAAGPFHQSSVTVSIAVGKSSGTFRAIAVNSGFKELFIEHTLSQQTQFGGLNVIAGGGITGVSVSSKAASAPGITAIIITPNGDGVADAAYINFKVGQQAGWHVLVSSLSFREGVDPVAIWEAWGFGDPYPGQVAWYGKHSQWMNNGAGVPSGVYYVRIELEGGTIKNDAISATVDVPALTGRVYDSANLLFNLPNTQIQVWGQYGGGQQVTTGADGTYAIPGLAAGVYKLSFQKEGYQLKQATVSVSGNTTLNAALDQASSLRITGGVASVQNFEQWGNLQVFNANRTRNAYSPLHVAIATTTIDDGGRWDPALAQFVTKKRITVYLEPDTYTVTADMPGLGQVSSTVVVGAGIKDLALPAFTRKANVTGNVYL
ncbi:MAG: carboxypeptidase regulatory-like domain-containing protein, partial [Elusimicrobiota bacterium]